MSTPQPALGTGARHCRFIELCFAEGAGGRELRLALSALRAATDPKRADIVIAFGPDAWRGLVPDSAMPDQLADFDGVGDAPATQRDVLLQIAADDPERGAEQARKAMLALGPALAVVEEVAGTLATDSPSREGEGARPGRARPATPIVDRGERGEGGSLVLSQRWIHDSSAWKSLSSEDRAQRIARLREAAMREGDELQLCVAEVPGEEDGAGGVTREGAPGSPPGIEALDPGLFLLVLARARSPLDHFLESVSGGGEENASPESLRGSSRPVSGSCWFAPGVEDLELAGWS